MSELPPIPTSPATRWRQFRSSLLPILVFGGCITLVVPLWRNQTHQTELQGIGESIHSSVSAPTTVRIVEWLVAPHALVRAGDPVVLVAPAEARVEFDRLNSLLAMSRMRSQASPAEDNAMNYEQIRIDLLGTKSELAVARIKLDQADRDVQRQTPLYQEKLVSQDAYEMAVNLRDALKAEVRLKADAVAQIEQRLEVLRPLGEPSATLDAAADSWQQQLDSALQAATATLQPRTLTAPIAGMVSVPHRQAGEFVPAGEPLLTVHSARADNIVAYLRQPYRFDPEVGAPVRVTTRNFRRQAFHSHIMQVGAQVEVLTNALAVLRPGSLVDSALPLIIAIPSDVTIRPGEIVDVSLSTPEAGREARTTNQNPM